MQACGASGGRSKLLHLYDGMGHSNSSTRQGYDVCTTCYVCDPRLGDLKATGSIQKLTPRGRKTMGCYLPSEQRTSSSLINRDGELLLLPLPYYWLCVFWSQSASASYQKRHSGAALWCCCVVQCKCLKASLSRGISAWKGLLSVISHMTLKKFRKKVDICKCEEMRVCVKGGAGGW